MYVYETRGGEEWFCYMGKDKFENEDLIKYAWPEDVWFHVEDMSSAHVYLRLPLGVTIDSIPENVLEDAMQVTKDNSIQGCKLKSVKVIYTMASNLLKRGDMEVGAVDYKDRSKVKVKRVEKEKIHINRLKKTKREIKVNLAKALAGRKKRETTEIAVEAEKARREVEEARKEAKEKADLESYASVMKSTNMKSNSEMQSVDEYEDNFM